MWIDACRLLIVFVTYIGLSFSFSPSSLDRSELVLLRFCLLIPLHRDVETSSLAILLITDPKSRIDGCEKWKCFEGLIRYGKFFLVETVDSLLRVL